MLVGLIEVSSEYWIAIETPTTQMQSIQLAVSYLGINSLFKTTTETMTSLQQANAEAIVEGFRVQLPYRFYFSNNAPNELYVAPHISYSKA